MGRGGVHTSVHAATFMPAGLAGPAMDFVFIQVTLNAGRTLDVKRAFYRAVADGLHERLGLRREDVFISLVEVPKENWSFGNGEAQYAT